MLENKHVFVLSYPGFGRLAMAKQALKDYHGAQKIILELKKKHPNSITLKMSELENYVYINPQDARKKLLNFAKANQDLTEMQVFVARDLVLDVQRR